MKRQKTLKQLTHQRDTVFNHFPFIFTLLTTFGVVATYNGLQRLIEKVPLLANNPIITLVSGLAILLFTGTLYKRLR